MATDPTVLPAWEPSTRWLYNIFILEYKKGGMLKQAGWSEADGEKLNQLGELGWEAFNVTRLNDTQFLVFMKLALPQHLGDAYDVEATSKAMDIALEQAARIFG